MARPTGRALSVAAVLLWSQLLLAGETVRDRLWIWGHPAGVYNAALQQSLGRVSTIQPVDAARHMGLKNLIFVRYEGVPALPFESYYAPFRELDRVYWSLVGAAGATSAAEREAVFALAEKNQNLAGFILDDFFHEPAHGNAADPISRSPAWLAANQPVFPVTLTATAPRATRCDAVELVQTDWHSGDYRAKNVAIDLSPDGKQFQQIAQGALPNQAAAVLRLALPSVAFTAARIRFLSTHDTRGALSVGLLSLRFLKDGHAVNATDWRAEASSTYAGYDPKAALSAAAESPFKASLTPEQLRSLGARKVRGRKLPIMAVIYTRQVKPQARAHIDAVDKVCMWTWRPADLKNLEANFAALKRLAPGKGIFLGCYTYDFFENKPLAVEAMQRQVALGHEWLKAGRIEGMIFLATPNVDVGLKAVDWTRDWIRRVADQRLVDAAK
jgi:hypothetical protein